MSGQNTILEEPTEYGSYLHQAYLKKIYHNLDFLPANNVFYSIEQLGNTFKYDANFSGPKKRRSYTDVVFAVSFFTVAIAWLICGILGKRAYP